MWHSAGAKAGQKSRGEGEHDPGLPPPPPPALTTVRGDTAAGTKWVVSWGGEGLRKVLELPSGSGAGLTLQERVRIERLQGYGRGVQGGSALPGLYSGRE